MTILPWLQDGALSDPFSFPAEVGVLLADVKREVLRWLWEGRFPLGKISVLDGDPGLGKSTMLLDVAARVSRGAEMPDGTQAREGGVVLLTAEDGLGDTVRPRLEAHGADLARIVALQTLGEGTRRRPVVLPDDLDALSGAVGRVGAALIVVDPLMAFLNGSVDSHRDQDVRGALAQLAAFADEAGVALILLRHLNKMAGGNPLYRGGGSIGIVGAARAGWLVAPHPELENVRVLAATKNNLAAPAQALEFCLDDFGGVPRVRWLGPSDLTAKDLLAAVPGRQGPGTPRDGARAFLQQVLADGPVPAQEVKAQAEDAGLTWGTLRRAAGELGVDRTKVGAPGSQGQHWVWALPGAEPGLKMLTSPEGAHAKVCAPSDGVSTFAGWPAQGVLEL